MKKKNKKKEKKILIIILIIIIVFLLLYFFINDKEKNNFLFNSLKDLTNVVSIKIAEISPSLGIHGGPGLMGFSVKMVK